MIIRIQLAADRMGDLLRERFKAQKVCTPLAVPAQNLGPRDKFVDHVEIGENSRFRLSQDKKLDKTIRIPTGPAGGITGGGGGSVTITAPSVQYVQNITVFQTTLGDLRASGINPPATDPLPIQLVFDLAVSANASQMTITFVTVESLIPIPNLNEVVALLKSLLPPASVPFIDVGQALGAFHFSAMTAVHAGLVFNGDATIEVRIEYGKEQTLEGSLLHGQDGTVNPSAWVDFYAGNIDVLTADGEDWAIFIDKDAIIPTVQELFQAGLNGSTLFLLRSAVDVVWSVNNGAPQIDVNFSGLAVSACNCFFTDIDVSVDVTANIAFSVDNGSVRLDTNISHSTNQLQLFCCEVTAGFLFPIVGAQMLDGGKITVLEYLGGLALWSYTFGIGDFIGAIVLAGGQNGSPPTPPGCQKLSDTHVVCTYPVSLNGPAPFCYHTALDTRGVTAVRGTASGMILAGLQSVRHLKIASLAKLEVHSLDWVFPDVTCSGISGELQASAAVVLHNSGEDPLFFCSAICLSDANLDAGLSESYKYCPLTTTVHLDLSPGDVPNKLVELFIRTSAGTRVVKIDPPAAPPDLAGFQRFAERWRLDHCFTNVDDWYRNHRIFNPKWLVDPGPEKVTQVQLWLIAVSGVRFGDSFVLTGSQGNVIVEGIANSRGVAQLSAMVSPQQLGLARVQSAPLSGFAGAGTVSPQISIKQVALQEIASVLFGSRTQLLAAERLNGTPAATFWNANGLVVYDLTLPQRPVVLNRLSIPGLRGVTRFGRGYIGWDEENLVSISRDIRDISPIDVALPGSIDAALGSHHLYVQCGGEVLMFDQRFEKVGAVPFGSADNLAAGGDLLAAHALDAAMHKAGAHPLQDAIGIIRGAVTHLHELLVRHDDGPTSVFDTRDPGNVALSARHPGRAWNAGAATVDRFFVTPDEAGLNFKVYVETGTKTI